jgi:hypothetical protein
MDNRSIRAIGVGGAQREFVRIVIVAPPSQLQHVSTQSSTFFLGCGYSYRPNTLVASMECRARIPTWSRMNQINDSVDR